MNVLKQSFSLRIPMLLLCFLLASGMEGEASNSLLRKKPSVVLQASKTTITYPCPTSMLSLSGSCPSVADLRVSLTSIAKDFSKPTYSYTVVGGRIIGDGSNVTWDLNDVGPGLYTATVEVQDHKKHRATSSVVVTIQICADCVPADFPCPTIVVTCYDEVKAGNSYNV
ncbi:MAG: hypothetical protein ACXW3C_01930 [Pyrinomonadaceae bacterium]